MQKTDLELLAKIAGLHSIPEGSFNIRKNGKRLASASDADIEIVPKTDKEGIDIYVRPGVKGKSAHIPVLLTEAGLHDSVYNDFHIGEGADVTIIAGCGIHCPGTGEAEHDGIHTFRLERGAHVRYIERHYAAGGKAARKVFNPVTRCFLGEDSVLEIESVQLGGVTFTERTTDAVVGAGARLEVKEKLLTAENEEAISRFSVRLEGSGSTCDIVSRSVARDSSRQEFLSDVVGAAECFGHVACDAIILDSARVVSTPRIDAVHPDASLVHEAAVGKIAGEQLVKLMSLGLDEKQAEDAVIKGYLN